MADYTLPELLVHLGAGNTPQDGEVVTIGRKDFLDVAFSQMLLVVMKPASGSLKVLLAFDFGISFDFVADLPVIGTALSSNDQALAGSFQLLAATGDLQKTAE